MTKRSLPLGNIHDKLVYDEDKCLNDDNDF